MWTRSLLWDRLVSSMQESRGLKGGRGSRLSEGQKGNQGLMDRARVLEGVWENGFSREVEADLGRKLVEGLAVAATVGHRDPNIAEASVQGHLIWAPALGSRR